MSVLPTGTFTFLFTDIEGSTALWEQHPKAMQIALERHHALLREAIALRHGAIFNEAGDGLCAAFASAGEALNAGLRAQRGLHQTDWGETPIRVRMGLNGCSGGRRQRLSLRSHAQPGRAHHVSCTWWPDPALPNHG